MNNKNTILYELETVAPSLISVLRTPVYVVPNGYFDTLSTNIINRLQADNQSKFDLFSVDVKVTAPPFSIPNDYFASFSDNILTRITMEKIASPSSIIPSVPINPYSVSTDYFENFANGILDKINDGIELKNSFSNINPYKIPLGYFNGFSESVLGMINGLNDQKLKSEIYFSRKNPYQTPVGYFNDLHIQILNKIKSGENQATEPKIHFSRLNPYQVPVGYFENLPNDILANTNSEVSQGVPAGYFAALPNIILHKVRGLEVESELAGIAPILNTINKKPINYVPTGYFEGLQPVLPQAAPVKVIGVKRKANWFKNAIAACLIGTLGFTAYQLMDASSNNLNVTTASTKPTITASNNMALPATNMNVDEELSKVDDESLIKYLDNIEMPSEQATVHFNEVNSGDVDKALQDIPDETIQQHLDETGELSDRKN